jgi:hypothetical protein
MTPHFIRGFNLLHSVRPGCRDCPPGLRPDRSPPRPRRRHAQPVTGRRFRGTLRVLRQPRLKLAPARPASRSPPATAQSAPKAAHTKERRGRTPKIIPAPILWSRDKAIAISSDTSGPTRGNRRRIEEDRTDRLEGGTPVRDLTSDTSAVQAGVVRWRLGKSGNVSDKEGRALGRERQLSARMRPHHKAQLEESVLCSRSRTPDAPRRQRRVSGWAGPRQGADAMRDKNPRTRLLKL